MPVQPQPLPGTTSDQPSGASPAPPPPLQSELSYTPPPPAPANSAPVTPAPVWLQRISLFILVIFCVYLGVVVAVIPWWPPAIWNYNALFLAHPNLGAIMRSGVVRGIVSGLGLLDIWIGVSEAIHYRDQRP